MKIIEFNLRNNAVIYFFLSNYYYAMSENKKEEIDSNVAKNSSDEAVDNEDSGTKRKELDVPDIQTNNSRAAEYFLSLNKRIKLSAQKEYDDMLQSEEFIRQKFLVKMPSDFFYFWDFLNELKPNASGLEILKFVEDKFKLKLVGAFEFVAGRFHGAKLYEPGEYLRHWRFFYDPPEFQTVFVRTETHLHYGYWRDDPQETDNLLLASNDSSKSCIFEFVAGNMFEAFLHYLENDVPRTPFNAGFIKETIKTLNNYVKEKEFELSNLKTLQNKRNSKVLSKTFHRAGIVVPYDAKSQQGYRPLIVSDSELKKILKLLENSTSSAEQVELVLEKLQPVATAATIALDECDFGTALELGINLFCSGHTELHGIIHTLLIPAYNLLQRPQFLAIAKAHMEKRSKEKNLSIFKEN